MRNTGAGVAPGEADVGQTKKKQFTQIAEGGPQMQHRLLFTAAVVASFIFCGCQRKTSLETDVASLTKNWLVSEDAFLAISNGAPLDLVRTTLGSAVRHEFSCAQTNGVYALLSCPVGVDIRSAPSFYFLFRDGILVKVFYDLRFPNSMETVLYQGTPWSRPRSWGIDENEERVRIAIDTPAETRNKILWILKDSRSDEGETKSTPLPAFLFKGYLEKMGPKIKEDYQTNGTYLKKFDGCRVSLGMTPEEVEALYGTPLRVLTTKHGQLARIYGDARVLQIYPEYLFSCVAVVFDSQERVEKVYGHSYFNDKWIRAE